MTEERDEALIDGSQDGGLRRAVVPQREAGEGLHLERVGTGGEGRLWNIPA
ncbi:MAG: hypothetical protein O3A47_13250 [Chloroflexi bacterium]|nr:hypothetical protein [Chloroflexota bacterium]